MERGASMSRSEAALERLLQRIDAAIDEYRGERRCARRSEPFPDQAVEDTLDEYWEAWWALPLTIRDWLLWYVPGWWALPFGAFRRLLLTTARLIVREGLSPRLALRRAATGLRLPPPRPISRRAQHLQRATVGQFRAAAQSNRSVAQTLRNARPTTIRTAAHSRRGRRVSVQRSPAAVRAPMRGFPTRARRRFPLGSGGKFQRIAFRR